MKRHVWVNRGLYKLYPNMFVVLVGRPGLGKGAALNPAAAILQQANTCNILSDRVTIEYVLERLAKGFPSQFVTATGGIAFGKDTSTILFSPELSIFITASQYTLPILADLWDCREGKFAYGTRHKGNYEIQNACVSMLAGSTQEWLISSIPSNAVGGGFTRRVNFVFSNTKSQSIPWPVMNHTDIQSKLVNDLRHIGATLRGAFTFAKDAEQLFESYYNSATPLDFDDESTTAYKTTKWAHATKLAMAIAAAEGDSLVITRLQFEKAIDHVEKVLASLQLVFRAVGESDLVGAADRVLRFLELKGYATRSEILRANWRHVSGNDLDTILATLTSGGVVAEKHLGNVIKYQVIQKP